MGTRSAAAIVAVMSALTFADAGAQNFIPRGPELNFVKPGSSVLTCSNDAVFRNAVLGNPLCDKTAAGGSQTSGGTGLFVDGRSPAGKYRSADDALFDSPQERERWRNPNADEHAKGGYGYGQNGPATDKPENHGGQAGSAAAAGSDDLVLALVPLNETFAAAAVTSTPEPASFVLMATGLLGVAAYGRRRSKGREGINN